MCRSTRRRSSRRPACPLTIPEGSRDAPYAVLLEADGENCDGGLELDGESIACHTVTVFDSDGEEETDVSLLIPPTITITLDAPVVEELGGIEGVRAARERGELRMLRRDDAESVRGGRSPSPSGRAMTARSKSSSPCLHSATSPS